MRTSMLFSTATCLIGEGTNVEWCLPTGLSGWVTTSRTSQNGASTSAFSAETTNSGVPKNTILVFIVPSSGAKLFFALGNVFGALNKQDPVHVVNLVLEHAA